MLKPITLWYVYDKKVKAYKFNHFENGHSLDEAPTPRFPKQMGWKKETWYREYRWDSHGEIVKTPLTMDERGVALSVLKRAYKDHFRNDGGFVTRCVKCTKGFQDAIKLLEKKGDEGRDKESKGGSAGGRDSEEKDTSGNGTKG